jgi:hypothetical protein
MGEIKQFKPVKLVICILISDLKIKPELLNLLEAQFGKIDFESEILDFNFTNYYNDEMGSPIQRFFISFQNLIDPDLLAGIKLKTNILEGTFLENKKRKINLDPGLIFLGKFILASTKDGSFRIPLSSGIYGEITLVYEKKNYRNVELTYPDFQSETYKKILKKIREIYKNQISNF